MVSPVDSSGVIRLFMRAILAAEVGQIRGDPENSQRSIALPSLFRNFGRGRDQRRTCIRGPEPSRFFLLKPVFS
jgi:hypothetical protein